jgi:hypothetical protein
VCFSTLACKLSSGARVLPDVLYSLTNYVESLKSAGYTSIYAGPALSLTEPSHFMRILTSAI